LSEEKKYKNYTAEDIEKYHKGILSPGEMNELEKAALDDPFLADALEGYGATAANISSDVSELTKKLEERVSERKVIAIVPPGSSFKWWKVAAAIVVLGALAYFVFQISTSIKNKEVATLEKKQNQPQAPSNDSTLIQRPRPDSISNSNAGQYVMPHEEIRATKTPKEKSPPSGSVTSETNKNDEVTREKIKPTQPVHNDNEPKDSLGESHARTLAAPVAIEKMPAIASAEQNNGAVYYKKIDMPNTDFKANYFSGRVKDANNNSIPFANITNTRDNVGTYADAQGRFTLVSPDSVLDVQVRSVGFENGKMRLKNNVASNDVVLQESRDLPEKVLSFQKADTSRSRRANVQFEELEPADGWNNYNTYLANNVNIPADVASKQAAKGQVQLSFEVNPQGDPINIKVEKSLCGKCDEDAVRAVRQGPKWKKKSKKAKRITITVPFDTEQ